MTSPLLTQFHAMFIIVIKELVVFAAAKEHFDHIVFLLRYSVATMAFLSNLSDTQNHTSPPL